MRLKKKIASRQLKKSMLNKSKHEVQFEKAVLELVDNGCSPCAIVKIKKALIRIENNSNKMFWLICLILGLPEGSTYARGARTVKRTLLIF